MQRWVKEQPRFCVECNLDSWFWLQATRGEVWGFHVTSGFYSTLLVSEGDSGHLSGQRSTFLQSYPVMEGIASGCISCGAESVSREISWNSWEKQMKTWGCALYLFIWHWLSALSYSTAVSSLSVHIHIESWDECTSSFSRERGPRCLFQQKCFLLVNFGVCILIFNNFLIFLIFGNLDKHRFLKKIYIYFFFFKLKNLDLLDTSTDVSWVWVNWCFAAFLNRKSKNCWSWKGHLKAM